MLVDRFLQKKEKRKERNVGTFDQKYVQSFFFIYNIKMDPVLIALFFVLVSSIAIVAATITLIILFPNHRKFLAFVFVFAFVLALFAAYGILYKMSKAYNIEMHVFGMIAWAITTIPAIALIIISIIKYAEEEIGDHIVTIIYTATVIFSFVPLVLLGHSIAERFECYSCESDIVDDVDLILTSNCYTLDDKGSIGKCLSSLGECFAIEYWSEDSK